LLGDFNARVGRDDSFKPTIGNESLHEISNDNGVPGEHQDRILKYATTASSQILSSSSNVIIYYYHPTVNN
jgi:hypothetical protein